MPTGNKCWVPHLPRFPAEACGVATLHAPFLNERRTRGPLWHSVAGNRGQAVFGLEWDNGTRCASSRPANKFEICINPNLCHPEEPTCLWQVEKENDTAKSPWMRGPEGRPPNVSPARKGWEINFEDDPSAVGAALNLNPLAPVSLGASDLRDVAMTASSGSGPSSYRAG
jgi:hypothetical protein